MVGAADGTVAEPDRPRIRLGVLTTSYPLRPGSVSGIFVRRLLCNLPERVGITVVTPADTDAQVERTPSSGDTVRPFAYAPRTWQTLAHGPGGIPVALRSTPLAWLVLPGFLAAFFLAAIRVARSSDVLFANWAISGAIGGIAARLVGIPLVTTIRGEDVMHVASSRLRGAILRLAVSRSRRVVTVSEAMADTLRGLFPEDREKIVHIANGVDFGRQRSVSNKASDGPLTMVTVGSLIPRKRVETIVDAMSRLNDVEDLRLVIVGDGEERPRLEQRVAELNLSARVSFTGMIPADAVPDILADADLFVLASESEGRPNVVLEAMANGLPVIGTKIPGVVELVEDGVQGATFEIGDTEGLAQAVRTLHDPNHRSRCGRAARSKIAEQNLTWEACAEAYSRLFDTLLAEV